MMMGIWRRFEVELGLGRWVKGSEDKEGKGGMDTGIGRGKDG